MHACAAERGGAGGGEQDGGQHGARAFAVGAGGEEGGGDGGGGECSEFAATVAPRPAVRCARRPERGAKAVAAAAAATLQPASTAARGQRSAAQPGRPPYLDHVLLVRVRDDHHGDALVPRPDRFQDVEPVHRRHHQIEEHQVEGRGRVEDTLEGVCTVHAHVDGKAVVLTHVAHHVRLELVVLDQQHLERAACKAVAGREHKRTPNKTRTGGQGRVCPKKWPAGTSHSSRTLRPTSRASAGSGDGSVSTSSERSVSASVRSLSPGMPDIKLRHAKAPTSFVKQITRLSAS